MSLRWLRSKAEPDEEVQRALSEREEAKRKRQVAENLTRMLNEDRSKNGYAEMVMKALGTER